MLYISKIRRTCLSCFTICGQLCWFWVIPKILLQNLKEVFLLCLLPNKNEPQIHNCEAMVKQQKQNAFIIYCKVVGVLRLCELYWCLGNQIVYWLACLCLIQNGKFILFKFSCMNVLYLWCTVKFGFTVSLSPKAFRLNFVLALIN